MAGYGEGRCLFVEDVELGMWSAYGGCKVGGDIGLGEDVKFGNILGMISGWDKFWLRFSLGKI